MKTRAPNPTAAAEVAIRATGQRLTRPRVAVLACLMGSAHAATHLEIASRLGSHATPEHAVDRVTVYRVLEWLVEQGIAHRIAGDDRVWRFMMSTGSDAKAHGQHAHFTCESCGQTFCLGDVPQVSMKLPKGFRSTEISLTVRGQCAHC